MSIHKSKLVVALLVVALIGAVGLYVVNVNTTVVVQQAAAPAVPEPKPVEGHQQEALSRIGSQRDLPALDWNKDASTTKPDQKPD